MGLFDANQPTRVASIIVLMLAVALAACSESGDNKKEEKQADPNLPPAQVDLPSPPPESAFDIPEKNPDGTLRVQGVIQYQAKHLGNNVRIKGVLVDIRGDCDPAKAKKKGEPCPEPHFIIKDEKGAEKELAVVGFDREFFERAEVEADQTHTFEGSYKKVAQGFANSESGLLLLDKLDDINVLEEKTEK